MKSCIDTANASINPRHWFGCEKEGGVDQSIRGLFLLKKNEEREDRRMEPGYDGINRD